MHANRGFCPITTDFKIISNRMGAFKDVTEEIEIIGFVNCGGVRAKRQFCVQRNWSNTAQT